MPQMRRARSSAGLGQIPNAAPYRSHFSKAFKPESVTHPVRRFRVSPYQFTKKPSEISETIVEINDLRELVRLSYW